MVTIGSSGQGHRDVVKHKRPVVLSAVYGWHGAHLVRGEGADDEDITGDTKGSDCSTSRL